MKVLNRNQELTVGFPMRGVRAQTACLLAGLALAGCMQTTYPAASAPRSDLDAVAMVPLGTQPSPGDTVLVGERWF
jgi:hypothetical protein